MCLLAGSASAASVSRLSWAAPALNTDATRLTDLAGFNVYLRADPHFRHDKQDIVTTVVQGVGRDPTGNEIYTAAFATPREKAWISVTAFDLQGNESAFSAPILLPGDAPPDPLTIRLNLTNGFCRLAWNAETGNWYRVQYTTDLADPAWKDLGDAVLADEAEETVMHAEASSSWCFYRVIQSETAAGGATPGQQGVALTARISIKEGLASITWNTDVGARYKVQYKERLTDTVWSDLPAVVTANGLSAGLKDPVVGKAQGFFRVVRLP